MSEAQAIALYHPLLNTIATKLIGCREAAEDIVQETYLKWLSSKPEQIRNTKAYLITSVRNNCLKYLESVPVKKREWLEKLPEDWTDHFSFTPQVPDFLEEEVRQAIAAVHQKLEPLEKAIFILRGIFQLEYEELQDIFQKRKDHCRQLFSRARKKLQKSPLHETTPNPEASQLWIKVDHAFRNGALHDLIHHLKSKT
ncbi:MAG: sigma-70 family RNA polymerase sigma factor [Cyclobacteriaceae bacterium]